MSNQITEAILEQWNCNELQHDKEGRVFYAKIKSNEFRFIRQTARKRSKMLLKAAPAIRLISGLLVGARATLTDNIDINQLSADEKQSFGLSIIEKATNAIAEIDPDKYDVLITELLSWAQWKNPATDKYVDITGQSYEKVIGDDLSLQIPLVACVAEVNYIPFSPSDSSG